MSESNPVANLTDPRFADPLGAHPRLDFVLRSFIPSAAMVMKTPQNGQRVWKKYDVITFSEKEYDIVPGMWDHEHCSVCWLRIAAGDGYWENSESHILCPSCHEEFQKIA
jgi:hypothetical protein